MGAAIARPNGTLFEALARFQQDSGLAVDGMMSPDGETERALRLAPGIGGPAGARLEPAIDTAPDATFGPHHVQALLRSAIGETNLPPVALEPAGVTQRRTPPAPKRKPAPLLDGPGNQGAPADGTPGGQKIGRYEFRRYTPPPDQVRPEMPLADLEAVAGLAPQPRPSALPADAPFTPERFDMLLRTADEIARLLKVGPEMVTAAGADGLTALLGIASSLEQTSDDRERLAQALDKLEEGGHDELVRELVRGRARLHSDPKLRMLFSSDARLRENLDRAEDSDDIATLGGAAASAGGGLGALLKLPAVAGASGLAGAVLLLTQQLNEWDAEDIENELQRRERYRRKTTP